MTGCQLSYFLHVWRNNLATASVRLRKHLRFAKCDECVNLRSEKAETRDFAKLTNIKERERVHYNFVKAERLSYYMRRKVTIEQMHSYCSWIVDGAD